jgi:hypothetical protein
MPKQVSSHFADKFSAKDIPQKKRVRTICHTDTFYAVVCRLLSAKNQWCGHKRGGKKN